MASNETSTSDIFEEIKNLRSNVCLEEISEIDITCMTLLKQSLNDLDSITAATTLRLQGIVDYMYEHVNVGNWKEVRLYLRKTITVASYARLLGYLKACDTINDDVVREALHIVDYGIVFGSPIRKDPTLLQTCATILNNVFVNKPNIPTEPSVSNQVPLPSQDNPYNALPIEVLDCPSMEHFYKNYIVPGKPVVLDNCINHWPALSKWKDQNYLLKVAGLRTVSIEVGKDYTDCEWTQKLMTIEDFIKNYVYQTDGSTAYLAQYQLFEQIPELKDDIAEPDYCGFSEKDAPVELLAWYGPKGTVSPLHHDPKKNLLTQIVGEKQIFVFSPEDSEFLYPHDHELLTNTARIDPRNPDLEKYPKFKDAKTYYCVLRPGQMLFIPPKWWHFVESLSVSFSVSFWWV